MTKLALFFAAALCAGAAAQPADDVPIKDPDHLVPLPSAFDTNAFDDEYPKIVTTVFKEAFGRDVRARVYVTAARPVQADMIFLKEADSDYRIVFLHTAEPLWMYRIPAAALERMHHTLTPPDYHDIRPERCETALPSALGKRVVELWKKVLLETRYETKRNRGMDGGDLVFSMEAQYDDFEAWQTLAGTAWSPDERTKPGMLAGIAFEMKGLCTGEITGGLADEHGEFAGLESQVEALEKAFATKPSIPEQAP